MSFRVEGDGSISVPIPPHYHSLVTTKLVRRGYTERCTSCPYRKEFIPLADDKGAVRGVVIRITKGR